MRTSQKLHWICAAILIAVIPGSAEQEKHLGLQHKENPVMRVIGKSPPRHVVATSELDTRSGFTVIDSLKELSVAMKKSKQKVRLKPGVYTAKTIDPPVDGHHHIFSVTGSNNHFDLRGVTIITPVSLQGKLPSRAHTSDCWHVFGDKNVFEGGYFKNEVDRPYPKYRVADNEFEIHGTGNKFKDCTFLIRGSTPYGYTDFYGKGNKNFGGLDKHSFMSLNGAKNTTLIGCKVYMQSFGHAIHLHGADGVHIEDCYIAGVLRPTNDIFKEKVGRAKDYDFNMMYRVRRQIPKDEIIPLSEDGIRTYGGDKNITVINTTIERMRGCVQVHSIGDVTFKNVTVREAGDFAIDITAGKAGKVVVDNCNIDATYRPVFNFTRGDVPVKATYEVTITSPSKKRIPTTPVNLGLICGDRCTFVLRDGTTEPLPPEVNTLVCGDRGRGLTNSKVKNHTPARLILSKHVSDCRIESLGPVVDHGKNNKVTKLKK